MLMSPCADYYPKYHLLHCRSPSAWPRTPDMAACCGREKQSSATLLQRQAHRATANAATRAHTSVAAACRPTEAAGPRQADAKRSITPRQAWAPARMTATGLITDARNFPPPIRRLCRGHVSWALCLLASRVILLGGLRALSAYRHRALGPAPAPRALADRGGGGGGDHQGLARRHDGLGPRENGRSKHPYAPRDTRLAARALPLRSCSSPRAPARLHW